MATIKDVAREAGVAISTVSRVLNATGPVADSTRRRVLDVVDRLNYSPNLVARSLVSGGTRSLALFLPDIMNPFFPAIARGIEDAAGAEGFAVMLCNTDGKLAPGSRYEGILRGRFLDGIIFCGTVGDPEELAQMIPPGLPVVVADRRIPGLAADSVEVDNRLGGALATQHLLDAGCRRILHLGGPLGVSTADERLLGCRDAVDAAGLDCDAERLSRGPFRAESGYSRTRAVLQQGVDFDGIFAANDLIALGALQALAEAGRRVPDEVAVVGFDDVYMAALSSPPLSTVAQPTYRLGLTAGRMLIERIKGEAPAEPRNVVLDPVLHARQSSRR